MPPLRIAILGSTGFTGSHLTHELLARGHTVVGLSRHPDAIGAHARYEPVPIDLDALNFTGVREVFERLGRLDGMICAVGVSGGAGGGGGVYSK